MDDDFATMSTYEQLEYRTGQLEAQRQISKLLNVRAERAEAERDALRDELARMSDEFADVLEVAIARGAALGYDSDSDYIQRWEELTGDEWVEE